MESNQELTMSMFANKEDYEEAMRQTSQPHEPTPILIQENTELVLNLKKDDVVKIDDVLLKVEELTWDDHIYLTTLDSDLESYRRRAGFNYGELIKHLRVKSQEGAGLGDAGMTREAMKNILDTGNYYIG